MCIYATLMAFAPIFNRKDPFLIICVQLKVVLMYAHTRIIGETVS